MKKRLLIFCVFVIFLLFFVNNIKAETFLGWWHFSNNANDSSANSLNGVLQNGADVSFGYLTLDGVNQYMSVADNDFLSFGNGISDSAFTISAWLNMNDATNFSIADKSSEFYLVLNSNNYLRLVENINHIENEFIVFIGFRLFVFTVRMWVRVCACRINFLGDLNKMAMAGALLQQTVHLPGCRALRCRPMANGVPRTIEPTAPPRRKYRMVLTPPQTRPRRRVGHRLLKIVFVFTLGFILLVLLMLRGLRLGLIAPTEG